MLKASLPVVPADLVAYQKDAVVSKTIIDTKVGTVTLFAFDLGQGLSEHTSPYNALVHLLDGEADITISGKPVASLTNHALRPSGRKPAQPNQNAHGPASHASSVSWRSSVSAPVDASIDQSHAFSKS